MLCIEEGYITGNFVYHLGTFKEIRTTPYWDYDTYKIRCTLSHDFGTDTSIFGGHFYAKQYGTAVLKPNCWYRHKSDDKWLFYHHSYGKGFGIDKDHIWRTLGDDFELCEYDLHGLYEAPLDEVFSILNFVAKRDFHYPQKHKNAIFKSEYFNEEGQLILELYDIEKKILILDVKSRGKWEFNVELPNIQGWSGRINNDGEIDYDEFKLNKEWFLNNDMNHITEMKLNNGITITEKQVIDIKNYLQYDGNKI